MILRFTLAGTEKPIYIRESAMLAVYPGSMGTTDGTFIQTGLQLHFVKDSLEDVVKYLDILNSDPTE